MTVLKDIIAISNHTHEKLSPSTINKFKIANASLSYVHSTRADRILRLLECILQLCGLSIKFAGLGSHAFTITIQNCIGLLLQGRILNVSEACTADYVRHLGKLHDRICILKGSIPRVQLSTIMGRKNASLRSICITLSEKLEFDPEKVWVWGGWTVSNPFHTMHLNLFKLYKKLGRAFTEKLYKACSGYFEGRTTSTIECLDSLVVFLSSDLCHYTPFQLQNPKDSRAFLVELANFHTQFNLGKKETGKKEVTQHVLINDWNAHFRTFVVHYLIPCGVIAAPCVGRVTIQDIPIIPGETSKQAKRLAARSKTINGGVVVKLKTITPLPMHAMNDNVIEALFVQMRHDYKSVVRWAELYIASIEKKLDKSVSIALKSKAALPYVEKSNLSDMTLIFERIKSAKVYLDKGFYPKRNFYTSCISPYYNLASSDLTEWLCLPKTEVLTAFTIYLAAKHEEITNSFLDKCLLPRYVTLPGHGVKLQDRVLIGSKPRARMPIQHVELCSETTWAVEVLIRLTNPARAYLKEIGSSPEIYTKLFIATGKGFGRPKAVTTKNMTGTSRTKAINARSMQSLLLIPEEEAVYLASNTSVNTVRATSVALQVIDHLDLTLATTKLKHALFDLRLLEHYLPKLILLYLMRREITNWNTRVLIQALDNHPRTAIIAGFKNNTELDDYLSKAVHLPYPRKQISQPESPSVVTVIIGVDEQSVCVLASLELAVLAAPNRATASALYWAGLYGALRNWIYSAENDDSHLQEIFEIGTEFRCIQIVESAAYDQ